ncbi:phenylalanine--tRNA ligase subunit alpha [Candidatus Parcubacteria bacterium]|nr:MAG: phenylalanine--tRNA ligase subunit alpha [Candidatus Parcubacteria bacterium]
MSQKNAKNFIDISAPGVKREAGHIHPLTQSINRALDIFSSMGFELVVGPELDLEFFNFDALNIPAGHPARGMQDTFWIKNPLKKGVPVNGIELPSLEVGLTGGKTHEVKPDDKLLLRTHTSSVQIHYMESHQPPFRIVVPGRVFRNEATDATHEIQFYQIEGLMIDKKTNLANLKAVLKIFLQRFFDDNDIEIRFRSSFFPFVEPGVEVDMKFKGKWMEIAGAGMVHPKVLESVKLNGQDWQGFAFAFGMDRLAMIRHKINDVRLFYSGDMRFLNQF